MISTKVKAALKVSILMLFYFLSPTVITIHAQESTEEILQHFVESYKTDHMAQTILFGIRVGEDWWHVSSKRKQSAYAVGKKKQYTFHNFGPHDVTLHSGQPDSPTWYFHFASRDVLDNIYTKKWTASTASAKSFGSDVVGLNIRDLKGFRSGIKDDAIAYEVMEHFWKRDPVEITYFTRDASLPTHGVDHVGLYTMKDKRIGWFSIGPEQAANAERGLDKGQVPNLFIITKGKGRAELGEELVELKQGMSVFIGPYVKHVLYNPYDEPLEGIIVLFGDNSDYISGKSYLDLLEEQHDFYERYGQNTSAGKK